MKKDKTNKFEVDIKELKASLQRVQADFDNYRKRADEQKMNLLKYANEDLILEVLPVLDNFRRSTEHIPAEISSNNWVQGMELIEKQLEDILSQSGLKKIEIKIGEGFNPQIHEAISCEKSDEITEDKILQIISDGYILNDKVIRHAKVKVCKNS
ncbi:MAG: co-chaperone GrpE [uncultured bacterium]|nr:MAG: co-chaperone GrpE [uncultured bacterium]